jgi:hypothetical protein
MLEKGPEAKNEERGFRPLDAPEWSSLANLYENAWFNRIRTREQIRTAQRNILPNPTRGGSPGHTKNSLG